MNPIPDKDASRYFDLCAPNLIEGDIAEFGVWNGGNTKHLTRYGRKVWAFDTFTGLPREDYVYEWDDDNPVGKFRPDYDVVAYLESLGVNVLKGRFVDTLPQIPLDTVFALVFIDCDYYESHRQVLHYLEERGHLEPGSMLLFDDYCLRGAHKAIEEWRGTRPVKYGRLVIF